jgi:hypothetical protein
LRIEEKREGTKGNRWKGRGRGLGRGRRRRRGERERGEEGEEGEEGGEGEEGEEGEGMIPDVDSLLWGWELIALGIELSFLYGRSFFA